jgi:hypothetical protein
VYNESQKAFSKMQVETVIRLLSDMLAVHRRKMLTPQHNKFEKGWLPAVRACVIAVKGATRERHG